VAAEEEGLALPLREQAVEEEDTVQNTGAVEDEEQTPTEELEESLASTAAVPSDAEVDTPSTSHPPSEVDLTHVATQSATPAPAQHAATAPKHTRNATIPAVPLIPFKSAKPPSATSTTQKSVKSPSASQLAPQKIDEGTDVAPASSADAEETPKGSPPKPAPPKSWAELLRAKNAPAAVQPPVVPNGNGVVVVEAPAVPRSNTLADVLASFSVESEKKASFLEPRGLVNTGNLCYMNSVRKLPGSATPAWLILHRFFKFFFSAFLSTTF
jgi:ubiquitin carboxyl-terminal hydrolase 10